MKLANAAAIATPAPFAPGELATIPGRFELITDELWASHRSAVTYQG